MSSTSHVLDWKDDEPIEHGDRSFSCKNVQFGPVKGFAREEPDGTWSWHTSFDEEKKHEWTSEEAIACCEASILEFSRNVHDAWNKK